MRSFAGNLSLLVLLSIFSASSISAKQSILPVTPHASAEATELLSYLYSISGKYTLTGQHCAPLSGSIRLAGVEKQTGYYPAVFGQDFGFSAAGSWDGINFRQQIVDEAIRRHGEGFIITIMWHALNPKHDEPVTFSDSVQTKLSDQEWQALTTPGTALHERWKSQVDVIAFFLKQLRAANVPVIWRPYHEMNGSWFWWGGRKGENGYAKLYRMLFDRLSDFHQLNNLLWVYNANEVRTNVGDYKDYYPGHNVVDIIATDVYSAKYSSRDYEQLLALAGDKPVALGEVGDLPDPGVLQKQPRWVWFMSWKDPDNYFWHDNESIKNLYAAKQTLTLEKLPWVKVKNPQIHYPVLK
jgi:mannan endo-1,4-beta-mannosidase